ncbi:hypothetical protein [Chitinophaga sp. GbtcB8]|uniref:hypothetical protein n=1 Tax=Chitinophaga sp. GbtcB8 TaxID=2824753 RepID=UPI001C2FD0D4|nr:hypothetical protein [Chitinophaga sp. GbtcB8]
MKYLLLPVFLLICITACKKKDDNTITDGVSLPKQLNYLTGRWKSYASYYSFGGEPVWKPAENIAYLTFNADGGYTNTGSSTYDHFELRATDVDTTLRIYKKGQQSDTAVFFISINENTLVLANRMCIEGCGEKYVREH